MSFFTEQEQKMWEAIFASNRKHQITDDVIFLESFLNKKEEIKHTLAVPFIEPSSISVEVLPLSATSYKLVVNYELKGETKSVENKYTFHDHFEQGEVTLDAKNFSIEYELGGLTVTIPFKGSESSYKKTLSM